MLLWSVRRLAMQVGSHRDDGVCTLNIIIEIEFVRMRAEAKFIDLASSLVCNIGVHNIFGEDIALQKKLLVRFDRAQRFFQRPWGGRNILALLWGKII